jgi:hypothetical protein
MDKMTKLPFSLPLTLTLPRPRPSPVPPPHLSPPVPNPTGPRPPVPCAWCPRLHDLTPAGAQHPCLRDPPRPVAAPPLLESDGLAPACARCPRPHLAGGRPTSAGGCPRLAHNPRDPAPAFTDRVATAQPPPPQPPTSPVQREVVRQCPNTATLRPTEPEFATRPPTVTVAMT